MSKVIAIIAFIAFIVAVGVGAQYFCVRVYAPWLLNSNEIQAIAFVCSPNCSK